MGKIILAILVALETIVEEVFKRRLIGIRLRLLIFRICLFNAAILFEQDFMGI